MNFSRIALLLLFGLFETAFLRHMTTKQTNPPPPPHQLHFFFILALMKAVFKLFFMAIRNFMANFG